MIKLLAATGVVIGSGCFDDERLRDEPCWRVEPSEASRAYGIDASLAELADSVPGFGGFTFSSPTLRVLLVEPDLERGRRAQRILAAIYARPELAAAQLELAVARYDYRALVTWAGLATNIESLPDVAFSDINEGAGRLDYGAANLTTVACMTYNLEQLGVPSAAFEVVLAPQSVEVLRER